MSVVINPYILAGGGALLVESSGDMVAASNAGANLELANITIDSNITGIAKNDNQVIARPNSGVGLWHSNDSGKSFMEENWFSSSAVLTNGGGIAYGHVWVLTGSTNYIYYTADGDDWTSRVQVDSDAATLFYPEYGDSRYVVRGSDGLGNRYVWHTASDDDVSSWQRSAAIGHALGRPKYGNSTYMVFGLDSGDNAKISWIDKASLANGVSWNEVTLPTGLNGTNLQGGYSAGLSRWVVVGGTASSSSLAAAYSDDDGATWSAGTISGAGDVLDIVTLENGSFVAVIGGSSAAYYSADGATWVASTLSDGVGALVTGVAL